MTRQIEDAKEKWEPKETLADFLEDPVWAMQIDAEDAQEALAEGRVPSVESDGITPKDAVEILLEKLRDGQAHVVNRGNSVAVVTRTNGKIQLVEFTSNEVTAYAGRANWVDKVKNDLQAAGFEVVEYSNDSWPRPSHATASKLVINAPILAISSCRGTVIRDGKKNSL